ERLAFGFRAASSLGDGPPVVCPLLGELVTVLGVGNLEAKLAERALAGKPPVLRRLHRRASDLERVLCDLRLLAGLDQAAIEVLGLRRSAAVGVPRLPPFLPDDAAAEELQTGAGLGRLPGGGSLDAKRLQARSKL